MISFVGAGPGAPDLISVRGKKLLEEADLIIYAGSLVNPELLSYARKDCEIVNSALLTLDEVTDCMKKAAGEGKNIVRLHTGEPSLYGAVREQMDELDEAGLEYQSVPGISACFGAASSLNLEYTLPGVSQTLIITRMEGRTAVPEGESIEALSRHNASMAVYLSAGMTEELQQKLLAGGYKPDTPAAIVYKATWPEEKQISCTVGTLHESAAKNGISKIAVILIGDALKHNQYEKSKLYSADFSTQYREKKQGSL